jgi:hypothetical protein
MFKVLFILFIFSTYATICYFHYNYELTVLLSINSILFGILCIITLFSIYYILR